MRRFSIRTAMALVLVSGVGLAALRNANDFWVGIIFSTALYAVGAAVLGAVFLKGHARAWWLGFSLFGGCYLAFTYAPGVADTLKPHLATSWLLNRIYLQVYEPAARADLEIPKLQAERAATKRAMAKLRQSPQLTPTDPAVMELRQNFSALNRRIAFLTNRTAPDEFYRVGHALFAILAGFIGGLTAVWFYERRLRDESAPQAPTARDEVDTATACGDGAN
jgi:hypothetical protein